MKKQIVLHVFLLVYAGYALASRFSPQEELEMIKTQLPQAQQDLKNLTDEFENVQKVQKKLLGYDPTKNMAEEILDIDTIDNMMKNYTRQQKMLSRRIANTKKMVERFKQKQQELTSPSQSNIGRPKKQ